MSTEQRCAAQRYLLKAIASAADAGDTPAAEALMALYEVLKQPVPPCDLPNVVRAGSNQPTTADLAKVPELSKSFLELPYEELICRDYNEQALPTALETMGNLGLSIVSVTPSHTDGVYLVFAKFDPDKISIAEIDKHINEEIEYKLRNDKSHKSRELATMFRNLSNAFNTSHTVSLIGIDSGGLYSEIMPPKYEVTLTFHALRAHESEHFINLVRPYTSGDSTDNDESGYSE